MKHFAKLLAAKDRSISCIEHKYIPVTFRGSGKLGNIINPILSISYGIYYSIVCKQCDTVILMEYLTPRINQELTAKVIKFLRPRLYLRSMIHLSGSHLMEYFSSAYIRNSCGVVDDIIVLGSTLKDFLVEVGVDGKKVSVTHHYVDHTFYYPSNFNRKGEKLTVICQGNIKRNYSLLNQIISECPDVRFIICQGVLKLEAEFGMLHNVQLYGYLSEEELLRLMQDSDVSLNVLEDTIGSNVITTSMAVGLVMVVSDVGSIRDYLDEECAFLCSSKLDFVKALNELSSNNSLVSEMKERAFLRSKVFHIDIQYINMKT
jgi:glycosyltransferase involved in cell wall biosynthesis